MKIKDYLIILITTLTLVFCIGINIKVKNNYREIKKIQNYMYWEENNYPDIYDLIKELSRDATVDSIIQSISIKTSNGMETCKIILVRTKQINNLKVYYHTERSLKTNLLATINGWMADKKFRTDSKWFWSHTTNDYNNRVYWTHHLEIERDSSWETPYKVKIQISEEK